MNVLWLWPIATSLMVAAALEEQPATTPSDERVEAPEDPARTILRLKQEMALVKKERDQLRRKVRALTAKIDADRAAQSNSPVSADVDRAMLIDHQESQKSRAKVIRVRPAK